MRPAIFITSCLAASAFAVPLSNIYDRSDAKAEFLSRMSQLIQNARNGNSSLCHDTTLPSFAFEGPDALPEPSGKLKYVALGLGTQNYTCAHNSSEFTPEAIGAAASLYDVSSIACDPTIVRLLQEIWDESPLPKNEIARLPWVGWARLGKHYFMESTPVFNLDTTPSRQLGVAYVKKDSALDAPESSISKDGTIAVPWLYLTAVDGTVGGYTSVYRVNTMGGSPPETCEGKRVIFTVPYMAEYYIYGN